MFFHQFAFGLATGSLEKVHIMSVNTLYKSRRLGLSPRLVASSGSLPALHSLRESHTWSRRYSLPWTLTMQ
jgi:hypothetical protein